MIEDVILTDEQQALLDGAQGETVAKIMKTLVRYGEVFGATSLVPITNKWGHIGTGAGLSLLKPLYDLMDQIVQSGITACQPFTVNPRPFDEEIPTGFLQKVVFKKMYGVQEHYEKTLRQLGLLDEKAFTCTCYMDEVGNIPGRGEILSWAESSAIVYANSVLGARCNRNSGILELFGSIVGYVPYFGLLTDEGRRADWVVSLQVDELPDAQLLGSAIGMKVLDGVPYIKGLDTYLGRELDAGARAYMKDLGAAAASNGSVGLFHVDHLTPEAADQGESLIREDAKTYVIDDDELERVKKSYPCLWKDPHATPKLAFIGCPHLSFQQLEEWTEKIAQGLGAAGKKKVGIPTVLCTAPDVADRFRNSPKGKTLAETGATIASSCPVMYMSNPLCAKMPVATSSNKLRTYSSARYYSDAELLHLIVRGGKM